LRLDQAAAVVTLWRSGQWDTLDIATVLNSVGDRSVSEADVVRVIDIARAAERGPELHVASGAAE